MTTVYARCAINITFCVLLSSCATFVPEPPQIVNVPLPIACLPAQLPLAEALHSDAELAAFDDYKLTLALFRDRRALVKHNAELHAMLRACQ